MVAAWPHGGTATCSRLASYRGSRLERATRRAADFDQHWAPLQTDWEDFVGGKPSQPNPPASDDVHR
jgi:hypothetical protein